MYVCLRNAFTGLILVVTALVFLVFVRSTLAIRVMSRETNPQTQLLNLQSSIQIRLIKTLKTELWNGQC